MDGNNLSKQIKSLSYPILSYPILRRQQQRQLDFRKIFEYPKQPQEISEHCHQNSFKNLKPSISQQLFISTFCRHRVPKHSTTGTVHFFSKKNSCLSIETNAHASKSNVGTFMWLEYKFQGNDHDHRVEKSIYSCQSIVENRFSYAAGYDLLSRPGISFLGTRENGFPSATAPNKL